MSSNLRYYFFDDYWWPYIYPLRFSKPSSDETLDQNGLPMIWLYLKNSYKRLKKNLIIIYASFMNHYATNLVLQYLILSLQSLLILNAHLDLIGLDISDNAIRSHTLFLTKNCIPSYIASSYLAD